MFKQINNLTTALQALSPKPQPKSKSSRNTSGSTADSGTKDLTSPRKNANLKSQGLLNLNSSNNSSNNQFSTSNDSRDSWCTSNTQSSDDQHQDQINTQSSDGMNENELSGIEELKSRKQNKSKRASKLWKKSFRRKTQPQSIDITSTIQVQASNHRLICSTATSSMTSITNDNRTLDSQNIEPVVLDVHRHKCLGITIIGQCTPEGRSVGIYCGGIQKNSAAEEFQHLIEAGDRIVSVDGEDIRNLDNDQAVQFLQIKVNICLSEDNEFNTITLGLLKFPESYTEEDPDVLESETTIEDGQYADQAYGRCQPDPSGQNCTNWVNEHSFIAGSVPTLSRGHYESNQLRQFYPTHRFQHDSGSASDMISTTTGTTTTMNSQKSPTVTFKDIPPYHEGQINFLEIQRRTDYYKLFNNLSIETSMRTVIKVANNKKYSGLKIKDRNWLRVIIKNAFLGADLVDWLHQHVNGLEDRRDAKQYAATLFQGQLIKATVQARRDRFSEKSYYTFH